MKIEPIYVQILVSALGVVLGFGIQFWIAERSRQQTARQSKDTLAVQHLVSERATASFIAEKRQKWIDELRADMAFHLALSQEIAWKWLAVKNNTAEMVEKLSAGNENDKEKILQEFLVDFSKENGSRDREYQERHIRIKLRLNPKEKEHIKLRNILDEIRVVVANIQGSEIKVANQLNNQLGGLIDSTFDITQTILKNEWQRLKQEVAYPDVLMKTIPPLKEDI